MIQFKNVGFAYAGTTASEIGVKHIDLFVETGECVLLCGRSGCGKTTITKLINGLIPNYFPGELNGDVQVDDLKVFETPTYQLAEKIGISVTHLSHIETGNTKLSLQVLVNIADCLSVQTDELLYDTNIKNSYLKEEILDIISNCSTQDFYILRDIIKAAKYSLDKYKNQNSNS